MRARPAKRGGHHEGECPLAIKLAAKVPRAPDGRPDLSGTWMHEIASIAEMKRLYGAVFDIDAAIKVDAPGMEIGGQHKYGFNILLDFKPGESPLRPEGAELLRRHMADEDHAAVCAGDAGIPLAGLLSEPLKTVQAPRLTIIMYELDNLRRQIFTDGRVLPKEFEFPAYLGYSAGHRERDIFVVETAGFNDKTMLDAIGTPHSEALHITERYHRRDFGHLDVEMTFDDRLFQSLDPLANPQHAPSDLNQVCALLSSANAHRQLLRRFEPGTGS